MTTPDPTLTETCTNTVIVTLPGTGQVGEIDSVLHCLQEALVRVSTTETFSLVPLPSFNRLLIVCPTHHAAAEIYTCLKREPALQPRVSYSLQDNRFQGEGADSPTAAPSADEYLEVPPESAHTRFLISPPPSPPSGWDFTVREDGPNTNTYHDINELSHLLFERLLTTDTTLVRVVEDQSEGDVPMEVPPLSKHYPIIILDAPPDASPSTGTKSVERLRTPMPPLDYALYSPTPAPP